MFRLILTTLLTTTAMSLAVSSFAQINSSQSPSALVTAASSTGSPIDYSFYDDLMSRASVNEGGRPKIAYDFLRDQKVDYFGNYISLLSRKSVTSLSKNDQLAYWLNVQNTVAIHAILQEREKTKSLKKLRGTAEVPGELWTKPRVTIAGQNMSLQDIETKLLTEFDNPNIIYGLYQGVRGGPSLSPTAYRGSIVDERLADKAKEYVNSKGTVSVKKDVVKVTPLFSWYQDKAFGGDDTALLAHLSTLAEPKLKSKLAAGKSFKTSNLNYHLDEFVTQNGGAQRFSQGTGNSGVTSRGYGS